MIVRRWSARSDACQDCLTSTSRHYALGLCMQCYRKRRHAGTLADARNGAPKRWSVLADSCLACGTKETVHAADGLCCTCYERSDQRRATYDRYRSTGAPREIMRAYRLRHGDDLREKRRFRVRRLRGVEAGIDDAFPVTLERLVLEEFENRCAVCGTSEELTLDHHEPLHLGNPLIDNAVVLCRVCNSAKGTSRPIDFHDPETLRRIEAKLAWCRARRIVESTEGEPA